MRHTVLWNTVLLTAGLVSFQVCKAADLFPYGETEGDTRVPATDDGSSPPVTFTQRFPFFEIKREVLFVNTNGVLSFKEPFTDVCPGMLPLPSTIGAMIAPYWDDIDITRFGNILYRLTTSASLLQRVCDLIKAANFGSASTFSPTLLFIVTWDRVAEYNFFAGAEEENTFQVVMATDGQTSFVLFLYNEIQWGQASIGFNAGDGTRFFAFSGVLTSATREIETQSNVGMPGIYVFQVDGSSILSPDNLIVSLEQSLYTVNESSGAIAVCVIGLRGRQDQSTTVTITTEDSTAIGGVDYVSTVVPREITGGSTECITIAIINDLKPENEEHFFVGLIVSLHVEQNITIARVNIQDDDPDINECEEGTDNCTGLSQCVNSLSGGFSCSCDHLPGFTISTDTYTSCEDIDECLEGTHNCSTEDPAPAECINTYGGFICSCVQYLGYRLHDSRCQDIDECSEGVSGCNHNCDNVMGSYSCFCNDGFMLMDDSRTCVDINECESDNGNCEQLCVNTLGSYQCECRAQEDNRSCEAFQCPMLVAPLNGTIVCSNRNQTTGSSCSFLCDTGFNLLGSQTRVCLPSVTWTGSAAICEIRRCETLEAPENGFVLLPCTGEFGSSCTIQCRQGFKINGSAPFVQTCLLDENNVLYWTEPPTCTEIDICESNPCNHDGSCLQAGDTAFECNCEGTGYTGPTCNLGIVSTPVIPTLMMGIASNTLFISAKPDTELNIAISGGESFKVLPERFGFSKDITTLNFTVTGSIVGYYSIQYQLSGEDASSFLTPEDAAVFVQSVSTDSEMGQQRRYFQKLSLSLGELIDSCCEPSTFFQCQGSSAPNRVFFTSACNWDNRHGSHASAGVVFAENRAKDFKLPISIAGIEVDSISSRITLPQVALGSCTPCSAVQPNCNLDNQNQTCYCYDFSISDTIDFLETLSLGINYIRNLNDLLPSWFEDIQVRAAFSNLRDPRFINYEYTTDLVPAEGLQKLHGCEMIEADTDAQNLYSVLRYGRAMSASIDGQGLFYVDRNREPDLENPMCFAVNLCKGRESPVFIQLSPNIHAVILSRFLQTYVRRNWDIRIYSVVLSRGGMPLDSSIMEEYWNGVSVFQPELPQFDLIVTTSSTAPFQIGSLSIELSFSGKIYCLYEERVGVMDGETTLDITNTIATEERSILLSTQADSPAKAIVNIIGDLNNDDRCAKEDTGISGIALKLTYRQRPEQRFFSNLLGFALETTECPFDAFLNLNNDIRLQGLSLRTRCPYLNLGRLTFTGMEHRLYFSGNGDYGLYCLELDDSFRALLPSLVIQSTLLNSRLPLGRFMSLSQISGNNSPSLVVAYTPGNPDSYAKMDAVQVAILGTSFNTNVTVSNGVLKYTQSVNIFERYLARLSVSASINEAAWERLPLVVVGIMDSGFECSGNCFNDQLEDTIHTELCQTGESAIMSLNRSKEQVSHLENQLNLTIAELNDAIADYSDSLTKVADANEILIKTQKALESAVREVMENTASLCGIQRPNTTCLDYNTNFQVAKERSSEELERARVGVVRLLGSLDKARQKFAARNSNAAITFARVVNLRQKIRQLQPVYESAKDARDINEQNLQSHIESGFTVYRLNCQETDILRIVNVTFNITITDHSPSQIPLMITYSTPFNSEEFEKEVTFNFNAPTQLSFSQLASELIAETSLSSPTTQKRFAMQETATKESEAKTDLN